jgi:uncharacterized protein (TIGR02001 family)
LLGVSAIAQAEWVGNIGVTSNYISRGITQTDGEAAVQGGVDYIDVSGWYAGVWASNVSGNDNGSEIDLYAGFSNIVEGIGYDFGVTGYLYPQANHDADYTELYAAIDYQGLSAGMMYTVGSKIQNMVGTNQKNIEGDLYYFVSAAMSLPFMDDSWSLDGTLGHADFKDDGIGGMDTSYSHLALSLTKAIDALGEMAMVVSKAGKDSGDDRPLVSVSWKQNF